MSDFILERNSFCASNASLVSWKDDSLAFFEQDASKRMASMMADNMDICFLPSKYDMWKLEVQDCLHFTLNRLFAADMIIFILSISDFIWNLQCEFTTIYRVFIQTKSNFMFYSHSYFIAWYEMIIYPRKCSTSIFN